MRRAYEARKWAFVSDYARLDIVYEHGGVYLDTDVELVKSLDGLLDCHGFLGIEYSHCINTGLGAGGEAGVELFRTLRDAYDGENFLRSDGGLNMAPCSYYQTALLEKLGYVREDRQQEIGGVTILPADILASKDWSWGTLKTTERTVAVHHGAATWLDGEQQALRHRQQALVKCFGRRFGMILGNCFRVLTYWRKNGFRATIQRLRE